LVELAASADIHCSKVRVGHARVLCVRRGIFLRSRPAWRRPSSEWQCRAVVQTCAVSDDAVAKQYPDSANESLEDAINTYMAAVGDGSEWHVAEQDDS
jgi:hypothetical protein